MQEAMEEAKRFNQEVLEESHARQGIDPSAENVTVEVLVNRLDDEDAIRKSFDGFVLLYLERVVRDGRSLILDGGTTAQFGQGPLQMVLDPDFLAEYKTAERHDVEYDCYKLLEHSLTWTTNRPFSEGTAYTGGIHKIDFETTHLGSDPDDGWQFKTHLNRQSWSRNTNPSSSQGTGGRSYDVPFIATVHGYSGICRGYNKVHIVGTDQGGRGYTTSLELPWAGWGAYPN